MNKFKNDIEQNSIPCYISNSVKRELEGKIEDTLKFLGETLKELIKYYLEGGKKRRGLPLNSPLNSDDIISLEKFFIRIHSRRGRGIETLPAPAYAIEEWVVSFLNEKIMEGERINIDEFLTELTQTLLVASANIESRYEELITFEREYIKESNEVPDKAVIDSLRNIGIHDPDATHIASAEKHIATEPTVFITNDYGTILNRQAEIRRLVNLFCCDPIYGVYHLH